MPQKFPPADQYLDNVGPMGNGQMQASNDYLENMPDLNPHAVKEYPPELPQMSAVPDYLDEGMAGMMQRMAKVPVAEQDAMWRNWQDYQQRKRSQTWQDLPRWKKGMEVLTLIPELLEGGGPKVIGSMFPTKNSMEFAAKQLPDAAARKAALEAIPRLRKAAGDWMGKARTSIMKKGTELGDFVRREFDIKGEWPTTYLKSEPLKREGRRNVKNLSGSYTQSGVVNLPVSPLDDPAVAKEVFGHELGHIIYNRIKAVAHSKGDPNRKLAQKLMAEAERAAGMSPFRDPSGIMGPVTAAAKQKTRGSSIPDIQDIARFSKRSASAAKRKMGTGRPHEPYFGPGVVDPDIPAYNLELPWTIQGAAAGRMGERVADFLGEGTSLRGQQSWTPEVQEEAKKMFKLY